MTHKITTSQLKAIIREAVKNASDNFGEIESHRETAEEKKARLDGKRQAAERLQGKSVGDLKATYLKLEVQAEQSYRNPVKHAFIWGALDEIRDMLEAMGEQLPKKHSDPWAR